MIPAFNDHGVLPAGRYVAEPHEVEQRFVATFPTSTTREAIYDGWRRRREQLFEIVPVHAEWVDGSFVTAKRDAGDLDVVTLVFESDLAQVPVPERQRILELTVGPRPLVEFGCHSFLLVVYPEGHQHHERYIHERGYWDQWWSKDRVAPEKGYLDIRGVA